MNDKSQFIETKAQDAITTFMDKTSCCREEWYLNLRRVNQDRVPQENNYERDQYTVLDDLAREELFYLSNVDYTIDSLKEKIIKSQYTPSADFSYAQGEGTAGFYASRARELGSDYHKEVEDLQDLYLERSKKILSFYYQGDDESIYGFSISVFAPSPLKWVAAITENCTIPLKERNVYFLYSPNFESSPYNKNNKIIKNNPDDVTHFLDKLKSKALSKKLETLFQEPSNLFNSIIAFEKDGFLQKIGNKDEIKKIINKMDGNVELNHEKFHRERINKFPHLALKYDDKQRLISNLGAEKQEIYNRLAPVFQDKYLSYENERDNIVKESARYKEQEKLAQKIDNLYTSLEKEKNSIQQNQQKHSRLKTQNVKSSLLYGGLLGLGLVATFLPTLLSILSIDSSALLSSVIVSSISLGTSILTVGIGLIALGGVMCLWKAYSAYRNARLESNAKDTVDKDKYEYSQLKNKFDELKRDHNPIKLDIVISQERSRADKNAPVHDNIFRNTITAGENKQDSPQTSNSHSP